MAGLGYQVKDHVPNNVDPVYLEETVLGADPETARLQRRKNLGTEGSRAHEYRRSWGKKGRAQ